MLRTPFVHQFHLRMACVCTAFLTFSLVGCRLTSIHTNLGPRLAGVLAVLAMTLSLPAYWRDKQQTERSDSALMLPWTVLVAAILPFPLLICARLRMPPAGLAVRPDRSGIRNPRTRDHNLGSVHWLGTVLNRTYWVMAPMLVVAIFTPVLDGKVECAQEFLAANVVAFAIAVPLFALLPAIGPWSFLTHPGTDLLPNPVAQPAPPRSLHVPLPRSGDSVIPLIPCHMGCALRSRALGIQVSAYSGHCAIWNDYSLHANHRLALLERRDRRSDRRWRVNHLRTFEQA
jgi:hypothetical protein